MVLSGETGTVKDLARKASGFTSTAWHDKLSRPETRLYKFSIGCTHTSKLDCTEFFCLGGVFAECEEGGISAKEVRMVLASTATLAKLWRQQGHQ